MKRQRRDGEDAREHGVRIEQLVERPLKIALWPQRNAMQQVTQRDAEEQDQQRAGCGEAESEN